MTPIFDVETVLSWRAEYLAWTHGCDTPWITSRARSYEALNLVFATR